MVVYKWKGQAMLPFYGICIEFLGALRPCAMLEGEKNTNFNQEFMGKKLPLSFKCCSNPFDITTHPKVTFSPCTELASGGDLGMRVACPSPWWPLALAPLAVVPGLDGQANPGKFTSGHSGMLSSLPPSLPAHCPSCQWDSPCWLH